MLKLYILAINDVIPKYIYFWLPFPLNYQCSGENDMIKIPNYGKFKNMNFNNNLILL